MPRILSFQRLLTALAITSAFALQTAFSRAAENLSSSTLTEIVREVSITKAQTNSKKPARVQEVLTSPDILRTGSDSRAEMIAPDQTVTRVGSNTVFSFSPNSRELLLRKGSLLFHSPSGKGGGIIRTPDATAGVIGTTLMVGATTDGGFKVLVMEGTGRVKTDTGRSRTLSAGQMVYALPGGQLSQTINFRLSSQASASALVRGFKKPLPSLPKINAAIQKQEILVSNGRLKDTGFIAGGETGTAYHVDPASREVLIENGGDQLVIANVNFVGEGEISSYSASSNGNVSVLNSSFQATSTSITSGGVLSVTDTTFAVPPSQSGNIALSARTLVLENVSFESGSIVSLYSDSGKLAPNPNTGAPVRMGDINFVRNVTYGGSPAQSAITGSLSGPIKLLKR